MNLVNIHQAKTHLSKLIKQSLAGEEIIIAKAGKPMVKLVPYPEEKKPRKPGIWKGKIWVSEDFDNESEEINALFYGNEQGK